MSVYIYSHHQCISLPRLTPPSSAFCTSTNKKVLPCPQGLFFPSKNIQKHSKIIKIVKMHWWWEYIYTDIYIYTTLQYD